MTSTLLDPSTHFSLHAGCGCFSCWDFMALFKGFRSTEIQSEHLKPEMVAVEYNHMALCFMTGQRPKIRSAWHGPPEEVIAGKRTSNLAYSKRGWTAEAVTPKAVQTGIVVIGAPPYTGKTSMLQCVQASANCLQDHSTSVFRSGLPLHVPVTPRTCHRICWAQRLSCTRHMCLAS